MRTTFIQVETKKEAENECSWAEKIVKVCGGYMCFESADDYRKWKNQK